MSNKAFLRFDELSVSSSELKKLPQDQIAFLALLCCCCNEVNTLLRLYSMHSNSVSEEYDVVKNVDLATKLFLARTLSAKLFEVLQLFEGKNGWHKTKDKVVLEFRKAALQQLDEMDAKEGKDIAATLRNECTNHYSLSAARQKSHNMAEGRNFTFYMHKLEGNSFYQLGEDLIFSDSFQSGRWRGGAERTKKDLGIWLDWTITVTNWLKEKCVEFFVLTVPESAFGRLDQHQVYFVDPSLVGALDVSKVPLFLRERQK